MEPLELKLSRELSQGVCVYREPLLSSVSGIPSRVLPLQDGLRKLALLCPPSQFHGEAPPGC